MFERLWSEYLVNQTVVSAAFYFISALVCLPLVNYAVFICVSLILLNATMKRRHCKG